MYSRNEILHAGAKAMWERELPEWTEDQKFDDLSEDARIEIMLSLGAGLDALWPLIRSNIQEHWDWEIAKINVAGGWDDGP